MSDNDNIVLCYPNYAETATLSDGSYTSQLPRDNAKRGVISRKARTTSTALEDTKVTITLPRSRGLGVIAIAGHNFSTSAEWQITLYDEDGVTEIHKSEKMFVWPALYSTEQMEWEDDTFWLGSVSEEERQFLTPLALYFVPDIGIQNTKVVSIDFFDEGNVDGYIQFGKIFVSQTWQPERNASLGISFGNEINTEVESSLDNTEYFDRKRAKRSVNFTLDRLTEEEAFSRIFSMQMQQGIDKEVLFAYNKENNQFSYYRRFLGRLQTVDAISEPYVDRKHQAPMKIIEII